MTSNNSKKIKKSKGRKFTFCSWKICFIESISFKFRWFSIWKVLPSKDQPIIFRKNLNNSKMEITTKLSKGKIMISCFSSRKIL